MKQELNLEWKGDMAFETKIGDHTIVIDAVEEHGGSNKGPTPKPLTLVSLAGCTAMDVRSILKKMRMDFDYFNVKVIGNLTEEHPKQYDYMKLVYEFRGTNLDLEKIKKAIELSQDRYCGVSAMFKKAIDLDYEINILE